MCGICGLYDQNGNNFDLNSIQLATNALRHRGPDDEGYLLYNTSTCEAKHCGGKDTDPYLDLPPIESFAGNTYNLAFGFRRLSILDLSPSGHQPMSSRDGQCIIIYNGEIYNYLELREELVKLGYTFLSRSDTEVLIAAYRQWGAKALKRLVGMFAFAILNIPERKIFLARDFFGIKPLYYTFNQGKFAFASEMKALLSFSWVSKRVNPEQLYIYIKSGLTDYSADCLLQNIYHLPPAHYLEIPFDAPFQPQPVRYWDVDLNQRSYLTFKDASEQLRSIFLQNIHLHLRSDVPVGAALSGGIDSSSIVMGMRQVEKDGLDIRTFSYIAEDPRINEEKWVDLIGNSVSASVYKVRSNPEDLLSDLEQLIFSQDEPFGSTSIYAQSRVFGLAKNHGITVMLDGQGADELLAGYQSFMDGRLISLLGNNQFRQALYFSRQVLRGQGAAGPNPYLRVVRYLLPASLTRTVRRMVGSNSYPNWVNKDWFSSRGVSPEEKIFPDKRPGLREQLYLSLVKTSLPMLLRYEDHNSMAHSIESRVPFLTPELVNFVFSLPEEYLLTDRGITKAIFREAMRGIVPDQILDRRDKIGFATPEKDWFLTLHSWISGILNSEMLDQVPALNPTSVQKEWQAVLQGKKAFDFRIWRWVNLVRWAHQFAVQFD